MAVGRNTNAPTQIVQGLTKDADAQVAFTATLGLARSPKTPVSILKELATHGRDDVRAGVARNPAAPGARQANATEQLLRERLRSSAPVERRGLSKEKDLPEWVYRAL